MSGVGFSNSENGTYLQILYSGYYYVYTQVGRHLAVTTRSSEQRLLKMLEAKSQFSKFETAIRFSARQIKRSKEDINFDIRFKK